MYTYQNILRFVALGAAVFLSSALPSYAVSVDFDSFATGPIVSGEQLSVSAIGSGSCNQLSAGGSANGQALCVARSTAAGDAVEVFSVEDIDFSKVTEIRFAVGTNSGSDVFDRSGGTADYLQIFANGQQLVNFRPDNATDRRFLRSSIGDTTPTGQFSDFTIMGALLETAGDGVGDLEFRFRSTGPFEQIGLDSISISSVPLPSSSIAFLGGLGMMAAARLVRRRASC
ncbi:MAG: hypothetical protein AAF862_11935 [Pseudomonadota bacterium]